VLEQKNITLSRNARFFDAVQSGGFFRMTTEPAGVHFAIAKNIFAVATRARLPIKGILLTLTGFHLAGKRSHAEHDTSCLRENAACQQLIA
jgi:hypothetical protein